MQSDSNAARLKFILSMTLFGTIGIFVRYISLPSSIIAFVRGLIGMLFLLLIVFLKKSKLSGKAIKANLWPLLLSGAAIGVNWILLFEAYRYTTVATATLCYYLSPIFVIIASPFVLKEKLSAKKIICVLIALLGMVFVSGVLQNTISFAEMTGILCGIGAALFYATVILLNKKITDIPAYDKTIVQLGTAAAVILPYGLLTEDIFALRITPLAGILLIVVGVLHTGFAYALYFGSMKGLKAQSIALFSYIDPVVAVLLSAWLLKEKMDLWGVLGACMILGSALFSELQLPKKHRE